MGSYFRPVGKRRIEPKVPVVDVGCGRGTDVMFFANHGHPALGLDYARGAPYRTVRRARRRGVPAMFAQMNLYDVRDVVTRGALLRRQISGAPVIYARGLLGGRSPRSAPVYAVTPPA